MRDPQLLGRWKSVPGADQEVVTMEFDKDGSLTYTIHADDRDQKIFLTFETEDGVIMSDQPSAPREERTRYRFTANDELVMTYDGEETTFVRSCD